MLKLNQIKDKKASVDIRQFAKEVLKFKSILNANLNANVGELVSVIEEKSFPFDEGYEVIFFMPYIEMDKGTMDVIKQTLPQVLQFEEAGVEGVLVFKLSATSKVEVTTKEGNVYRVTSDLESFLNSDTLYDVLEIIKSVRKKVKEKEKLKGQIEMAEVDDETLNLLDL